MFDFLYGYGPSLLEGGLITVILSIVSLFIASILGLITAFMRLSKVRLLQVIALIYTTIIRGIPELVMMLLIFFGGQILINKMVQSMGFDVYIDINPFFSGSMTIGLIFGAYMGETFRGAYLAVPVGQIEAARSCGMNNWKLFKRILFPQMTRHALPSFGNNWLVLVKSTALVSVIGLEDVVRKADLAGGSTHKPFNFWIACALIYLFITSISNRIQRALEKRYNVGFQESEA